MKCSCRLLALLVSACLTRGSAPAQGAAAACSLLLLSNLTLIDGRGGTPVARRTLVIRDSRIAEIRAAGAAQPKGATVLDCTGLFVLPGLIDSHLHLPGERDALEAFLTMLFDHGIIAVRDMAGNVDLYKKVAPGSREAATLIPRLYYSAFLAGPTFFASDPRMKTIPGAGVVPWSRAVTDDTDIPRAIRDAKASGATAIKIYADLSPQLVRALASEAHVRSRQKRLSRG